MGENICKQCDRQGINLQNIQQLVQLNIKNKKKKKGTSLVGGWVGIHAPNAGGPGSIPGQGTRSHMHAATESSHAATKKSACCN